MRLIDAQKERPVWSASYEGELRDVFVLQSPGRGRDRRRKSMLP